MAETLFVIVIVIGALIILGLFNNIRKIILAKNANDFLSAYCEKIKVLQQTNEAEIAIETMSYLVHYSSEASDICYETEGDTPILELTEHFKNHTLIPEEFERLRRRIVCNAIEANRIYDKKLNKYYWYFANPFVLFYQGIELIMLIVFGYPIRFLKSDFDFEGELWNKIIGGISIVGGLASIIALGMEICKFI